MSAILLKIQSLWLKVRSEKVIAILAIVVFLGFGAVLVYFFHSTESLERFLPYGYIGVFLVRLISTTTIFLPVPGDLMVWLAGGTLGPFLWSGVLVGLVASVAGALGELTGYYAGYWGRGIVGQIEQRKIYQRSQHWLKRYGSVTIFVLALLPFPFDVVGIAAGVLRFPVWKFILAAWLGRLPREIFVAYLGAISVKFFFPGLF